MKPRLFLFIFLLYSAASQAQPPAPETVATPYATKPRVGPPEQLLRTDIQGFINAVNTEYPFPHGFNWVWKARLGYFGANEWGRWWKRKRGKAQLALKKVDIIKLAPAEAEVTLTYVWQDKDGPVEKRESEGPFPMKFGPPATNADGPPVWQFVPQKPRDEESLDNAPLRWAVYMLGQQPEVWPAFRVRLCMDNMKSLASRALQFTNDWDDVFAFLPEFTEDALQPYLRDEKIWFIPGTQDKISFNARLSGIVTPEIEHQEKTILFYDGKDEKPNFRYDGKTAVCFVDGHVELADAKRFASFLWR